MLRRIERSQLQGLAAQSLFTIPEADLDEYLKVAEAFFHHLDMLWEEVDCEPTDLLADRDAGRPPAPGEDPYNAIVRWCRVKARDEGVLAGKRIGLKDSMAVAGIPMTCGSAVMQGYVPHEDCVLASRLLAAGAEIVAILNMDDFAFAGDGSTSHYGPTLNPLNPARLAGGSSSGSASALFYPGIDITFGTDQGGSVRVPASWCGVLGLKPTHGLVPYTGILGIDQTFDHVGPLARSVADISLALDAVAGKDASDPRQPERLPELYSASVANASDSLDGFRVGVLVEGMQSAAEADPPTASAAREAIERLASLGAEIIDVSVPDHLTNVGLAYASMTEGLAATLNSFGNGYHWKGRYSTDLALQLGKGLRERGADLPATVKIAVVVGNYLRREYFGSLYAKAQNQRQCLRTAYDRVLNEVDFLVMPTSPRRAHELAPDGSLSERLLRCWNMLGNTTPFDMTGHPSLSMPIGEADGLPVGLMVSGRMFDEARILSFAQTCEMAIGWFPSATHQSSSLRHE
jgi:amidase